MRIVAIIQARMGSTRLPGKVMKDIAGEPMLARVASRMSRCEMVDQVVVATSVEPADDAIARLCRDRQWRVYRGSEADVLDRYYRAAVVTGADAVVRITSDCPLIDPVLADRVVSAFLQRQPGVHYACSTMPERTYPRGLDTEVVRFDALMRAWKEDDFAPWREHVTQYIKNNPDLFRQHGVTNDTDLSHLRWTVDTAEDLEFVRRVYGHFGHDEFSWTDVLAALDENPDWAAINSDIEQKAVEQPAAF